MNQKLTTILLLLLGTFAYADNMMSEEEAKMLSAELFLDQTNGTYWAEYKVEWDGAPGEGEPHLLCRLHMENRTYSENADGLYMGIGWGSQRMIGADVILCTYDFGSDNITCIDATATNYSAPIPDND